MARYLLLVHRSPAATERLAPAELELKVRSMVEWVGRGIGAGVIRAGARIGERAVRVARGGGGVLPYVAPNPAGTFFILEAESFDAAIAIASGCPLRELAAIDVLELDPQASLRDPEERRDG